MRLVAVSLSYLVTTGCFSSPSAHNTAPQPPPRAALLVSAPPANEAVLEGDEQPFLFQGELVNGDRECAAEYGFTFADVKSFGSVEGQDAEGRIYHCRYDRVIEKGALEWTADCEVRDAQGSRLRVLTMMHTALEPSLGSGIDAYDAFWVRGIVDLESGAAREECAYGGRVVHRAAASIF